MTKPYSSGFSFFAMGNSYAYCDATERMSWVRKFITSEGPNPHCFRGYVERSGDFLVVSPPFEHFEDALDWARFTMEAR